MIYVIATVELQPGQREAFLAEFHQLVPLVRAEEGCLEYGPAVDVATTLPLQDEPREDVVTVMEKWESVDALERHLVAPHMKEYRTQVKDLVAGTALRILEPAEE